MCDVKKFNVYTEELMNLDLDDYRQLILEADSPEKRQFYINVYNYFLKQRQAEVLEQHIF